MDLGLPYTSLIESLENQVARGTFTAWSCAHAGGALAAFYADEAEPAEWLLDQSQELQPHQTKMHTWFPAFDLASLTKPLLANAWLRMHLGADPELWFRSPLASLIEPRGPEGELLQKWCRENSWMTLAHLLNHTSGLKPWTWFGRALWQSNEKKKGQPARSISRTGDIQSDTTGETAQQARMDLTAFILSLPVQRSTGESTTVYSDLNYYLLARVIENLAMQKYCGWQGIVDELNERWNTKFWHASTDPERSCRAIPYYPYVHSQVVAHVYENRKLTNHAGEFGAVHDTNANILATDFRSSAESAPMISSHAGLFGHIIDVAKTVPFFIQSQSELEVHRLPENIRSRRFSWGMDTPSDASSTAGLTQWPLAAGRSVFGHLGYTGTSLWMANDGQFHVLLTNRTACRRVIGSSKVPRILIFQKDSETLPECWIKNSSAKNATSSDGAWQPLEWKDAYTLCFEQSRMVTRYWDRLVLRKPPDLANVRKATGQLLWTH
jgi:CubicO group peptidase (beta-lactamase class C family)